MSLLLLNVHDGCELVLRTHVYLNLLQAIYHADRKAAAREKVGCRGKHAPCPLQASSWGIHTLEEHMFALTK